MPNISSFTVLSGLLEELYLKEGILLIPNRYMHLSFSSSFWFSLDKEPEILINIIRVSIILIESSISQLNPKLDALMLSFV